MGAKLSPSLAKFLWCGGRSSITLATLMLSWSRLYGLVAT